MPINIESTNSRRKHRVPLSSPFTTPAAAKIAWLSDPGPHRNIDLLRWFEAEFGNGAPRMELAGRAVKRVVARLVEQARRRQQTAVGE